MATVQVVHVTAHSVKGQEDAHGVVLDVFYMAIGVWELLNATRGHVFSSGVEK